MNEGCKTTKTQVKYIDIKYDIGWYHGTWEKNIESIRKDGFKIQFDNSSQYTSGVYLLDHASHPRIRNFGNVIIQVYVNGRFIDATNDYSWDQFYKQYAKISDPKAQYDAIRRDYPRADGVKIGIGEHGNMLVVWNTDVVRYYGIHEKR